MAGKSAEPVALESYLPLPQGDDQYSASFIQHNEALILQSGERELVIGMCNPQDVDLRSRIEAYHAAHDPQKLLDFVTIATNELFLFLGQSSRTEGEASLMPGQADDEGVYLDRIANDAPVVNLVNTFILQAYNEGASDIHLDARAEGVQVRFRIDGILRLVENLGKHYQTALSSRIKVMAQLNIMERRLPQDGRCSVTVSGRSFDIRVSTLPSVHGESLVLRILRKDAEHSDIESLGFDPEDVQRLAKVLRQPHGLFLATGPTGSGKTTSLHGLLKTLPATELKIITLEDPVEYQIAGITQVQINEEIGLGFESSLRRVLRQDPDVIMVGEIRDQATASLAVRAALTGHLVLSSLHTNTAAESVSRLVNLGVEPYLMSAVIRGVIGQRLVRRLCPACAAPQEPLSAEELLEFKLIGLQPADLPQLRQAVGCERCKGSGYLGRLLVYEMIIPNETFRQQVAEDHRDLYQKALPQLPGFRPFERHALELLVTGRTSLNEIRRTLYL